MDTWLSWYDRNNPQELAALIGGSATDMYNKLESDLSNSLNSVGP